MNVLQLATVDNGGATWFYRDALLEHTDHDCRAVRTYQGPLDYPAAGTTVSARSDSSWRPAGTWSASSNCR